MDTLVQVVDRATRQVSFLDKAVAHVAMRLLPTRKASACYGIYCGTYCVNPPVDPCLVWSKLEEYSFDSFGCPNHSFDCYVEISCC